MVKKIYLYLLLGLCSFFVVNNIEVRAEVIGNFNITNRRNIYLDNCDSSGNCSKTGSYTIYKKTVDGKTAYCMQLTKKVPNGTCTRRDSWWHPNAHSALIAAQIIKVGNSQGYNEWNAYLWIQEALNCAFKSDYTWPYACNSKIVQYLISQAKTEYSQYVYTELSYNSSLPKPKFSGNIQLVRNGSGKYTSKVISLKNLVKKHGGDNYETTKVSYTLTATTDSGKGTISICNPTTGNCAGNTITIYDETEKDFIIKLTNAGDDGGTVNLSVKGTNASSYPTTYYWDCGSYVQRVITEGGNITIKRSTSANYSLIYNKGEEQTARVEKKDTEGKKLKGAKVTLYTAKDKDGTVDKKTLCTIDGTTDFCQKSGLKLDGTDGFGYDVGRYICYVETKSPSKYKLKSNPICEEINKVSSVNNYISFGDETQSDESEDIDNFENHVSYCNATKYKDLTEKYINDVISAGLTNNSNLSIGECEGTSKATICINKVTDDDGNDSYVYDSTGKSCESTSDDDGNNVDPLGQKYCIIKESYKELEKKSCGTDGLVGDSVCYNKSTNKEIDDKFCASGTNLVTVTSNNGSYVFIVENIFNEILISKKSINGNDELPGAILSLYTTKNGECTNKLATSESFTYSSVSNNSSSEILSFDNIADTIELLDDNYDPAKDGLKWVSSYTPALIQGLESGTYCLKEEVAPKGYKKVSNITKFKMDDDGNVQLIDNGNKSSDYDKDKNILSIHDDLINISISKQEMTTGNELPGATLSICGVAKNKDGDYEIIKSNNGDCSVVTLSNGEAATWVSTDKPHVVKGIGTGAYYLVEITSPDGYAEAESIFFKIDENGNVLDKNGTKVKDSKIIMKDKKIENVKTGNTAIALIIIVVIISLGYIIYSENNKKSII